MKLLSWRGTIGAALLALLTGACTLVFGDFSVPASGSGGAGGEGASTSNASTSSASMSSTSTGPACSPPDCDDHDKCTKDTCAAGGTCAHTNESMGTPCGTGLLCDGQGACVGCTDATQCGAGGACATLACTAGKCVVQMIAAGMPCSGQAGVCDATGACVSCTDAVQNGDETDVDCGGSCGKCAGGKKCAAAADCTTGQCFDGVCCNNACTGICEACNLAGSVGSCTGVTSGSPDPDTCPAPGACVNKGKCAFGLGQPCSSSSDCASSYCADGVCCNGSCGACKTCNAAGSVGTCTPVPDGQSDPGNCNGPQYCVAGACHAADNNGTPCTTGAHCYSGTCVDGVCCQNTCTGTCQACNVPGYLGQCRSVPQGQQDPGTCDGPGQSCSMMMGNCVLADGQACTSSMQCASSRCIDGVCCNALCSSTCQACNVAGSVGTCTNVPAGSTDPGTCVAPKACNGAGSCI